MKVKLKMVGRRARLVKVADYAEASAAVRRFIDAEGIGNSAWQGGDVTDDAGTVIARVSYNGRVWPPGEWSPGQQSLYEPSSDALPGTVAVAKGELVAAMVAKTVSLEEINATLLAALKAIEPHAIGHSKPGCKGRARDPENCDACKSIWAARDAIAKAKAP